MTLFGTDGIRGRANEDPMTPDMMTKIAYAAARVFKKGGHRHSVVIGKDTRLSGYMIEPALTAGFISMGMDVMLLGPLPTPAVSMLIPSLRADMGVMISASHNPYHDNGLKFFGPQGEKLSEAEEKLISQYTLEDPQHHRVMARSLGRARRLEDASGRYIEFTKATCPSHVRLDGLRIVIDCAHGAAYRVAPRVLWELGADVISMGIDPNGENINDRVGATFPKTLQQKVLETKAHVGIALDGDADRIIMCDDQGRILSGDHILALIAEAWCCQKRLRNPLVVGTVMTNLGLRPFLKSRGVDLYQTQVGDKYIARALSKYDGQLGGEPSGHILLSDYAKAGDGLMAGLQVLASMVQQQKSLKDLAQDYQPWPQKTTNIRLQDGDAMDPSRLLGTKTIQQEIAYWQEKMGGQETLLVRLSGTEPLIRLMAQCPDDHLATLALKSLEHHLKKNLSKHQALG